MIVSATPTSASGRPTGVISNSDRPGWCDFSNSPVIRTFVVVPIPVTMPPNSTAALKGMRYQDDDRRLRRAQAATCGASIVVVGVL